MADVIVFRRIGGRVVPIKMHKNDVKGVAAIGAGVGVGALAGKIAANMVHKGAGMMNTAETIFKHPLFRPNKKGQYNLFQGAEGHLSLAHAMKTKGLKTFRARNAVLLVGDTVAGALIGYGVRKLAQKPERDDKKEKVKSVVAATFGAAAPRAFQTKLSSIIYRTTIHPTGSFKAAVKYAGERSHIAIWLKER
jgi:hypothetical protein